VQKHLATYLSTEKVAPSRSVTLNVEPEPSLSPEAVKPWAAFLEEKSEKMILNPLSGGVFADQNRATGPSDLDLNQVYNPEVVDSPVKESDVPMGLRTFIDRVVKRSRCQHSEDAEALKGILGLELPAVIRLELAMTENNVKRWKCSLFETRTGTKQNGYLTERIISPKLVPLWKVVKDIVTVMFIFGYRDSFHNMYNRMLITFIHWCILANHVENNFIKVAKYKLAAFASWAKGSEMFPKNPFGDLDEPHNIFDKAFTTFLERYKRKNCSLIQRMYLMSFVDSICRGIKKGADRPGPDACHESCLATVKLFTRQDKPKLEYVHIDLNARTKEEKVKVINQPFINSQIRRSIDELLYNAPVYEPIYSHVPSFSSGTEAPVKDGGQCRVVKKYLGPKDHPLYRIKVKHGLFDGITRKPVNPYEGTDTVPLQSEVSLEEYYNPTNCKYVEMDVPSYHNDLDIPEIVERCLSERSVIHPIGLSEALKVRGITTPNPLETWLLKPLQKYLANCLLRFKCFAVTGTPLEPKHLFDVFKWSTDVDGSFVSGDYDNATNEMNSCYTREAILYICEKLKLDPRMTRLAERSLVDNYISYEWEDLKGSVNVVEGQQTEAQPMGKVLSFVILCIINFAVCRTSLELDRGRKVSMRQFPGLINGDDCCFRIKNFDTWVGVTSCVGLFNSIGKTFYSSEFVEMNSRTFLYERGNFFAVPFINFGLVRMVKRSEQCKGKESTFSPNDDSVYDIVNMGPCNRDLLMGLHSIYEEIDLLFMSQHAAKLADPRLMGIHKYIPEWLGGLGCDPGPRPYLKITDDQRRMASVVYKQLPEEPLSRVTKVKNCKLNDLINETFKNILSRTHLEQTTSRSMIDQENRVRNFDKENQSIYNSLLELLWRNMLIDDFFISPTKEGELASSKLAWKKLNRTQRMWKKAYQQLEYVRSKPLAWHKLWHQKAENAFPIVQSRGNTICLGSNCICCRYEYNLQD
jgi:hypothetical protein